MLEQLGIKVALDGLYAYRAQLDNQRAQVDQAIHALVAIESNGHQPEPTKTQKTKAKQVRSVSSRLKPSQPVSNPIKPSQPATDGSKKCSACGDTKPIDAFPRHSQCAGGHSSVCKACVNAKAKERYERKHRKEGSLKEILKSEKPYQCACGKGFLTKLVYEQHQEKCAEI